MVACIFPCIGIINDVLTFCVLVSIGIKFLGNVLHVLLCTDMYSKFLFVQVLVCIC